MIISVSLFGYYVLASATCIEQAIVGKQLTYVGGCYLEFFSFLILLGFCNIKPKKWVIFALFAMCTLCLMFVTTIGHNDWFYTDPVLGTSHGYSYIIHGNGPLRFAFYGELVILLLAFFAVLIYAKVKKMDVAVSNCKRLALIEMLEVLVYFLQRALNVTFEILPFGYIIMEVILLRLLLYMNIYDVEGNITSFTMQQNDTGFLFIDYKRRYLGCNDAAIFLLPELKALKVEENFAINEFHSVREMNRWLDELDRLENASVFIRRITEGNKTLRCIVKPLFYGKQQTQVGYCISVTDDSQQQRYITLLNDYNVRLEDEVREKVAHIADIQDKMVLGMANLVENRDNSTGGHIKRTSHSVRIFVDYLSEHKPDVMLSDNKARAIWKAAPMHDLGKVAVRDVILLKQGKYEPEEYEEMKQHAAKGALMVEQVLSDVEEPEFLQIAKNVAHYHHEKWDGSGYPEGLSGEQIPLEARIMALADVFDALVSVRCYKEAMSYDQAFCIIRESLGSHFDPILGGYFIECRDQLIQLYEGEA